MVAGLCLNVSPAIVRMHWLYPPPHRIAPVVFTKQTHTHVRTYKCTHTHTHIHIHKCSHPHARLCCTHTHIHTRAHTHILTDFHSQIRARAEAKLANEKRMTLLLKGENGIMRKKFTQLSKDISDQKVRIVCVCEWCACVCLNDVYACVNVVCVFV